MVREAPCAKALIFRDSGRVVINPVATGQPLKLPANRGEARDYLDNGSAASAGSSDSKIWKGLGIPCTRSVLGDTPMYLR